MKILEEWGQAKVAYFYDRITKTPRVTNASVPALFSSRIIWWPIGLAFVIGFVFTLPIIAYEFVLAKDTTLATLLIYGAIMVASVFLEFYFLFLLGFATLAYCIHHLYLINKDHYDINEQEFVGSLVRTVMELPEKRVVRYNLNPYEYKENHIMLFTLLYKAKVMLTNIFLKFLLKKALTRSAFRVYTPFIAAPVTGAWDAVVFLHTIRQSRYKIIARFTILYLIRTRMELLAKEHTIQLILYRYYYMGEYHGSLDLLLQSIYQKRAFSYEKKEYLAIITTPTNSLNF